MLIGADEARAAILSVFDYDWDWSTSEVDRLCAHLGWAILRQYEHRAILGTNLPAGAGNAYLSANDGLVEQIWFQLCRNVLPGDEARAAEIEESYHVLAGQLTAILGKPREIGETSILRHEWWNPPSLSITLMLANGSVAVYLASSAFRKREEEWDQLLGKVF